VIDNYGTDAPPHEGQTVKIQYVGKILTTSGPSSVPFASGEINDNLEDVLPTGLGYALSVMLKGSSGTVYIPSKWGYGEAGTASVPANSILVYDIYVEDVVRTTAQVNQMKADTAAIHTWIKVNKPDAIMHPAGFWYTIDQAGSGAYPTPYSVVSFDYTLKLMTNTGPGTAIQQNSLPNTGVFGLIDGLKLGFPRVQTGAKVTFYIPSTLGYGTTAQTGIPANSNLVFEITLTSITQ
jgi:FKBP-type peptidyl-prolyl cis-trans isomerase FkpA